MTCHRPELAALPDTGRFTVPPTGSRPPTGIDPYLPDTSVGIRAVESASPMQQICTGRRRSIPANQPDNPAANPIGGSPMPLYGTNGAQLKDSEPCTLATPEHRYARPLHVAIHVPLPSGLALILDSSFSSGRHPVWPALTILSCFASTGEFGEIATHPDIAETEITAMRLR